MSIQIDEFIFKNPYTKKTWDPGDLKKKKLLAILFIFHSFTVLVKTMVIINKYKMKVNRKIAPSLPWPPTKRTS